MTTTRTIFFISEYFCRIECMTKNIHKKSTAINFIYGGFWLIVFARLCDPGQKVILHGTDNMDRRSNSYYDFFITCA